MSWDDKVAFGIYLYLANCIVHAMPTPTGTSELYLFVYRLFHLVLFNIRNVIQTSLPSVLSTTNTQVETGTSNGNPTTNIARTTSLEINPKS